MAYSIRKATSDDLTLLADHNQAMALETENRQLDRLTVTEGVRAVLNDPQKGHYWVAEYEGAVVANLMITIEWSDWRNAPVWWFQSVYVKPEHRGKSLFSRMYRHIEAEARSSGVRELRLYVEKTNEHAQMVYRKLGMEQSHYYMFEAPLD